MHACIKRCILVCIYACTYVHIHACRHVLNDVYVYALRVCIYARTYVDMHACMHAHTSEKGGGKSVKQEKDPPASMKQATLSIHVCMCVCMYVRMYVYCMYVKKTPLHP